MDGELKQLQRKLLLNPTMGVPLGHRSYKIRLAVRSKGKGKSGGLRVFTYLQYEVMMVAETENNVTVNLIAIIDKSEMDSISHKELKSLIAMVDRT